MRNICRKFDHDFQEGAARRRARETWKPIAPAPRGTGAGHIYERATAGLGGHHDDRQT